MTDAELIERVREIVRGAATAPGASYKPGASLAQIANLLLIHSSEQVSQPPAPAPSVRVRIAVAVNEGGCWYGCGSNVESDGSSAERACEYLDGPTRVSFVTASVPLPVPQAEAVIDGEVTP